MSDHFNIHKFLLTWWINLQGQVCELHIKYHCYSFELRNPTTHARYKETHKWELQASAYIGFTSGTLRMKTLLGEVKQGSPKWNSFR